MDRIEFEATLWAYEGSEFRFLVLDVQAALAINQEAMGTAYTDVSQDDLRVIVTAYTDLAILRN